MDFGLAAKQRPVLILAYPQTKGCPGFGGGRASNLPVTGIARRSGHRQTPLASQALRSEYSRICQRRPTRLIHKLGKLSDEQFSAVKDAIREMLSL